MNGIFDSPPFMGNNPLTTPIAYLSQVPKDVFGHVGNVNSPETAQHWYCNWDYAVKKTTGGYRSVFIMMQQEQGAWRLHSSGPDMHGPDTDIGEGQAAYDATNGTLSRGDVLWTQKGQLAI